MFLPSSVIQFKSNYQDFLPQSKGNDAFSLLAPTLAFSLPVLVSILLLVFFSSNLIKHYFLFRFIFHPNCYNNRCNFFFAHSFNVPKPFLQLFKNIRILYEFAFYSILQCLAT